MIHFLHISLHSACSLLMPLLLTSILTGCNNCHEVRMQAVNSWKQGALEAASEQISEALELADKKNRCLVGLDKAMIDLSHGRAAEAEAAFRRIHPQLEYLSQTDLTEELESVLTDATARAWRAHEYEGTMLLNNVLLASLLSDGFDSFAWSIQLEQHLRELQHPVQLTAHEAQAEETDSSAPDSDDSAQTESPSLSEAAGSDCPSAAFASYLCGLTQSEYPSRAAESRQAIQQAAAWSTDSRTFDDSLEVPAGLSCAPGNGAVHVIVYRGVAPQWQSVSAEPTQTALLLADRILSATNKYSLPPTIMALEIAEPEQRPAFLATPCRLQAAVDDAAAATLDFHLVADLHDSAEQAALRSRDQQLAEAICRRVVKKAVVYSAKELADVEQGSMTEVGFDILGIVWEALEEADTRAWNSLPGQILTAATELPAGDHNVRFTAPDGTFHPVPVSVESGKNSVILVIMPNDDILSILCNRSAGNLSAPAAKGRIQLQ